MICGVRGNQSQGSLSSGLTVGLSACLSLSTTTISVYILLYYV